MKLSEELAWRGFVNQTTFASIDELDKQPRSFYWGCDPSADSLQIGNLAAGMMARCFIKHGYAPVLLIGGATGMIGDPKDDAERALKNMDEINKNKQAITGQYNRIFSGQPFELVDNYDWFKDIGYLDFLRDVGKHFSMTQLLDREFVKSRVGEGKSGLSYAEFSYSLIQGYDFLELYRTKHVTLQLCGADQWGNSLAGVELIRKLENAEAHVWSSPLIINQATGKKFGKSEEGAVWLSADKTSIYKFYQFWLNVDDAGVGDYLKVYTFIEPAEHERLMAEFAANPGARAAQKYLAFEVTKIVHGEAAADSAQSVTEVLFGDRSVVELGEAERQLLAAEIPTVSLNTLLIDVLIQAHVATSNNEARRLLEGGAVTVNGEKATADHTISDVSLVKKGKNSFVLVM